MAEILQKQIMINVFSCQSQVPNTTIHGKHRLSTH